MTMIHPMLCPNNKTGSFAHNCLYCLGLADTPLKAKHRRPDLRKLTEVEQLGIHRDAAFESSQNLRDG